MKRAFAILLCILPSVEAAELTLVNDRQSDYTIHLAPDAAPMTALAAREWQRGVQNATGILVPILTDPPKGPAVRFLHDPKLPQDGFEIRIDGRDLILAGNDTQTAPPSEALWFVPSQGTYFAAVDFLERFLDVRWLLPGEWGEVIPTRDSLVLSLDEPVRGAPGFAVRQLAYVGESDPGWPGRPKAETTNWMRRHRLTNAFHAHVAGYGHSWDDYLKPADMEAHPEWKSTRGEAVRNGKVTFFCTTAPGLVELFAARVIESMDRNPTRPMSSISPTDGGGFCDCERCRTLIGTDPHGKPNHAAAILTFYQQVAAIIARERPGRRLGGFVYYNYQYPPEIPPALPDNLSLCWAPLNYYGYGLLKPVYRDEFEGVMKRWAKISPRLTYHNYSTWMRGYHGAPLPVSLDILRRELPAAAANHAWGARMVGTTAWGVNAPVNYLIAKQLWNPAIDLSATLDEWLSLAYGPGWPEMRDLYDALDERMRLHKEAESPVYKGSQYEINAAVMRAIYAPFFPEMERRTLATLARCETEPQRRRLAMFGDNLIQLHHALRQAGMLERPEASTYFRDDTAFAAFLKSMESGFSLYRDERGIDHGPIWEGEYRAP